VPYVLVPHEPDVWLRARVEKQWRYQGRWRLSVYYYVGLLQHYRVYDADQCRPIGLGFWHGEGFEDRLRRIETGQAWSPSQP
jgi:hypothetical protein